MSDADKLTQKLIAAGANTAKVIAIIDGYGDAVDWTRGGKLLTDTLDGENIYGIELPNNTVQWFDTKNEAINWNYDSLDNIIADVWESDLNSGDEPDSWIINEICSQFGLSNVTE